MPFKSKDCSNHQKVSASLTGHPSVVCLGIEFLGPKPIRQRQVASKRKCPSACEKKAVARFEVNRFSATFDREPALPFLNDVPA